MLNKIIQFSIKNKLVIAVLTMGLIVWGLWSASRLAVDALPDVTDNQVQVITRAPTLAAQEVEQFITSPVERAMSNIVGVSEMRSFSRFGLSVITVVFEEKVNVYFARQLIAEKLKDAEREIPKEAGVPELGPVTTGLGEIYQYVIHPKNGSEGKYSAMDLRTMQDWIVGRQLNGIPGVAEVTGFGGISKQYEVAVNPDRLKAMNVTIPEIFTALEKNNENTGGAYIDRKPNAYFIRGVGLVKTFSDIESIVIKQDNNGIPVLIRDVATVQFGSPPRYGAMTYNGEKEVVGGLVLMMKGANSASVVELVKERMKTVEASLPEDVLIEAFLDRTNLIDRAITTVKTNLVEGALIVILVLVLFLGNLRAGLIVASAIPLSLLFALAFMNVFGISANLMSLGAIDFGLIVDGAVIIVEATLHFLGTQKGKDRLSQSEMDIAVQTSAQKMMSSAAFGQVIILIVYLPILSLEAVEGKMFRPMAQTVGFAILGALLLSLTYIPVMSAVFLSRKINHRKNLSDKMMDFFQSGYTPLLKAAIKMKYSVIGIAAALLIISIIIFKNMGGEFIPTLEEGDYAIEFVLPQGSSLSQTTETVMLAERMLLTFPEVKMVVGKTGAADIATDPMPPEASDLMVIMKNKKEWKTTKDFYALAGLMRDKLADIPGVIAEPSQPIQMRFNELMTGIRQDVAIKIFGENLDSLVYYADKTANAIRSIEGITPPQVERVDGLPQITIEYDRPRLAGYGLNIEDVNHVISAAFAGETAGAVYENERKFDLVVRLDSAHRTSMEDVSNLYIPLRNGMQIPLSQIATVSFKTGPAQISREAGKRRIYVSFNVSGRDVEGVVEDARQRLEEKIKLPSGYYYTYSGTFENLKKASGKLMIVVPLALLLIFFMLYLAFRSVKEAALIFTAIPMSAIGGVFALLLRGMPFSISAGIGFIALFGVAVLNGIVLISTFNQMEKEGISNLTERVWLGTKMRLRPVLMTAIVASLGFLPMALSNGAGAEVQRPLATVVIGGLITATFLTLIVLPCLYIIFSGKTKVMHSSLTKPALVFVFLFAFSSLSFSQIKPAQPVSFEELYDKALRENLQLKAADLQVSRSKSLSKTGYAIPNTGVFVENEDINPGDKKGILKIGVSQTLDWPGLYKAKNKLLLAQVKTVEISKQIKALEIKRELQSAYYFLWYYQSKQMLWTRLDSIYSSLAKAATLRVKTGESAGLDSIAAQAKSKETNVQLQLLSRDIETQQELIRKSLHTDTLYLASNEALKKLEPVFADTLFTSHPLSALQEQNIFISGAELAVTQQSSKPNFEGRFFSQRLYGTTPYYSGFSLTVGIPIFGKKGFKQEIEAGRLDQQYQQSLFDYQKQSLSAGYKIAFLQIQKNIDLLNYYEQTGLSQAVSIIKAAQLSYRAGEISFAELSQYLAQAIDIERNYLDVLNEYNQSVIQLNYYSNR